jgi:hypothetical protein
MRAEGRCTGAHFGTYDYTASCDITAAHQSMDHPAAQFALDDDEAGLRAARACGLSDGATTVMPVAHPPGEGDRWGALTGPQQRRERPPRARAWRTHVRPRAAGSLANGFYQGWDLHPAQLPVRYAASATRSSSRADDAAAERLRSPSSTSAAQATWWAIVFDDAATGQGLLNFFLRAKNCGALTEDEAARLSGLSAEELASRSFVKILAGRRKH